MAQIPIKTICITYRGEVVLATSKIFTLAGKDHPFLNRSSADWRISIARQFFSIEIFSSSVLTSA